MPDQHKFRIKLLGVEGMEAAALKPPFDVPTTFGTRGRVPVKGTINGAPFRSSLMNMGTGHMMVVNAKLRAASKCKAGDTVDVVMERDEEKRTVTPPAWLKKVIHADAKAKASWAKLSFTHQREYVEEITGAKKEETRERRVAQMLQALRKGERKK